MHFLFLFFFFLLCPNYHRDKYVILCSFNLFLCVLRNIPGMINIWGFQTFPFNDQFDRLIKRKTKTIKHRYRVLQNFSFLLLGNKINKTIFFISKHVHPVFNIRFYLILVKQFPGNGRMSVISHCNDKCFKYMTAQSILNLFFFLTKIV